jgi:hypothetical protein
MIKIKFHAPWRPDDYVKNWISKYTKDGSTWNDLILVDGADYDFIVIFNHPAQRYNFDKKRAIIFQGEPSPIRQAAWGSYAEPNPDDFFYVWNTNHHFNSVGWSFAASWKELKEMKIDKTKLFSGVISNKNSFIGQKRRLAFVREYLTKLEDYVHYGRGTGLSTEDKSDALFPYKYTFNAENVYEQNYFTEKITDAIVAECLCFYDGCPNLHNFYDPKSYVKIDLSKPDEAIQIIKSELQHGWEDRYDIIWKEKQKILDVLQPMPLVESIIKNEGIAKEYR